ncbi:amidohydrolase family protein [Shewanella glacialipiscicola]|uniref:amidohydrolase family protein n=1 Tax=Shewanella glacialipiscicola TaxID=614069 RepID=UPI0021DB2E03|nr:amidohydrolase family protein [Shewanella glacialipiscicola]MCU7994695.1 amidohydrolase family protein [Shewanella glacialipiscicola]MCU8026166.1 amidohydrolase family protein [Shewanella glacialipiscicola]
MQINNKIIISCSIIASLVSQATFAKNNTETPPNKLTALTHAELIIAPGKHLTNATLLVENNHIKAIIEHGEIPAGAFEIDLSGYTIYPGFIDPFTDYAIEFEYPKLGLTRPVYDIKRIGGNAENGAIHSEKEWFNYVYPNKERAKEWINNGFTSVQSSKLNGIFRGTGVSLSLAAKTANEVIYRARSQTFMAFDKGSSEQDYPESLMGSIALIRQTFADASWYNQNKSKLANGAINNQIEFNIAFERLDNLASKQIIFETKNLNDQLRAAHLLKEHKLPANLLGNGQEYSRINELKALNYPLILPLNYPQAPDVGTDDTEREVSLADLRQWERAPTNPAVVAKAGIPFALTQFGIKTEDFWPRLRQAIAQGLSEDQALAALTTQAAKMAGTDDFTGKLAPGYMADFVITKGNIFKDGQIYSVWLQGQAQTVRSLAQAKLLGDYQLSLDNLTLDLSLQDASKGNKPKIEGNLSSGDHSITLSQLQLDDDGRVSFTADLSAAGISGLSRFTLWMAKDGIQGRMTDADSRTINVAGIAIAKTTTVIQTATIDSADQARNQLPKNEVNKNLVSQLTFPNVAYGLSEEPKVEKLHIKNATLWTSDKQGILEHADLLMANGRIEKIGQQLNTPSDYQVLDATGKHLTAGIVDEHSHIAINGGTNEGTDAVTSEVRIGDVINPDDISLYRALAGGVTSAQLLHGSANPIGGQAQLIKMKWGEPAEQLKFANAPASIKFALGENVKQSNWGEKFVQRFPQTRMGVKAFFEETFDAALAHEDALKAYNDLRASDKKQTIAPRPSYRLQAVAEVLNQQRDVHIHSYVQSEILMFIRLAEAYHFKVQTFTHVLEGYKVAGELAAHGAGASTFADWWAYKFEVYDAIPQNACLMQNKGVITSINSDDYEMQRRLNQEAAKSMMYCNMSKEDAWNMVTINPAKQLRVDEFVGSLTPGKMADIVLWNAEPLSIYAKVTQAWVEGKRYFDRDQDQLAQQAVVNERAALIQKILSSDEQAKAGEQVTPLNEPQWHCDTHYQAWGHAHQGAK